MNSEIRKPLKLLRILVNHNSIAMTYLVLGAVRFFLLLFRAPKSYRLKTKDLKAKTNGSKIALRRLFWFAHISWFPFKSRSDFFFNITECLDYESCSDLLNYMQQNNFVNSIEKKLWIAELAGYLVSLDLNAGELRKYGAEDENYSYDTLFCDTISDALNEINFLLKSDSNASESINYIKEKESFSRENAYRAIQDINSLFGIIGWKWFVISGTFLGAVRQKDFLGHDYDIDIGVYESEFDLNVLVSAVSSEPDWSIKSTSECIYRKRDENFLTISKRLKPLLIKLKHVSGLIVDIFIHIHEANTLWHGSAIHRWDNSSFKLSEYNIGDCTVYGPDNAEKYLTENYGSWRTPVTNFDCSVDTPNVSYPNNYKSVCYLTKVAYRFWLSGNNASSSRYIESMLNKGLVINDNQVLVYK